MDQLNSVKVEVWSCDEDGEVLTCTTEDDAISEYLTDIQYDTWERDTLPEKVIACGFVRKEINPKHLKVLDSLLEYLDEMYKSSEEEYTKPTNKMILAERVFMDIVREEYVVSVLQKVVEKEVNVEEWLASCEYDFFIKPIGKKEKINQPG